VFKLVESAQAWGKPEFSAVLKEEIERLDPDLLPLQKGLSKTSYIAGGPKDVVFISAKDSTDKIDVRVGIFYAGINAGSCCADDPTPVEEETEYCEVQLAINKKTAETEVVLLDI